MEQNPISDDKDKEILVHVNNQPVTITQMKVSGLFIKQEAIRQGVQIEEDFNLFEILGAGNKLKPIDDNETVVLHPNSKFKAVAPDDNS